jgi:5'-3' exonuclease
MKEKECHFREVRISAVSEREYQRDWSDVLRGIHGFTPRQLVQAAVLTGCDYLPSFQGLGICTAFQCVRRYGKTGTDDERLQKILMGKSVNPKLRSVLNAGTIEVSHAASLVLLLVLVCSLVTLHTHRNTHPNLC